jgi:hypothetical protein
VLCKLIHDNNISLTYVYTYNILPDVFFKSIQTDKLFTVFCPASFGWTLGNRDSDLRLLGDSVVAFTTLEQTVSMTVETETQK